MQLLNPGTWGGLVQTGIDDWQRAPFWIAALQIVFINLLLSGDNAVIIAMACRGLPPRQRFWGLLIGAGVAVVLLIVFTAAITRLLLLPYLKLCGGLILMFIAVRLLLPEDADASDVEAAGQLWRAVRVVVVADIVMSFDNIMAVAAIAKGDLAMLAVGLIVSVPLIIAGAALVTALLERLPILVWVGAGLLGWVAGETVAGDPAVLGFVQSAFGDNLATQLEPVVSAAGVVLVIVVGGIWRHYRAGKIRGEQRRGRWRRS